MSSKTQSPSSRATSQAPPKPPRIHWLVRWIGIGSVCFLGFVYFGMLLGTWLGLGAASDRLVDIFITLGSVAIAANIIMWLLADSMISGEGYDR